MLQVHRDRNNRPFEATFNSNKALFPRLHGKQESSCSRSVNHSGTTASCSRGVDEIVLDLLRGKVCSCHEALQRRRNIALGCSFGATTESNNATASLHTPCVCKFLLIVDCAGAPQYWLVQLKLFDPKNGKVSRDNNYLNCVDRLELYDSLDNVQRGQEYCNYLFTSKNWFFFESLLRLYVAQGVDVLLEDFTMCDDCCNHL